MKKIFMGAAVASLLFACSGESSDGFQLSIDIPSAGDSPVKVTLEGDSVIYEGNLTDGSLTANLSDFDNQFTMVQIMELGQPAVYFHDGADVNITFDEMTGFNIEAGVMNDSADALNDQSAFFGQTMQVLEQKYMTAMDSNDVDAQNEIREEAMNLMESQERMKIEFAKRNDILGAAIALSSQSSNLTYEDLKAVLDQVSPEFHSAPDYTRLAERVETMGRSAIGMQFKDFAQTSATGGTLNVLAVEGKYVLVDFWASWCRPCRAANPALVELYNTYHEQGFNILGVSLDRDGASWQKGIKEDGLPWPQISDLQYWQNEISTYYGIQFIPQNILIDDNGVIVAKNMEPAKLGEFLSNNL
ncbi:MAG: TlpA family protein disulfide reductase [Schleiferiaceae bacterium]|jgi:thiol-disulfide isomerase/thioredoxin